MRGLYRDYAEGYSLLQSSRIADALLKTLPVSHKSARVAVNAVLPGLEKRVERAKAHEPKVTEVKQRLEQTRRNFRQLRFRETDQDIIEAGIRKVYRQGRRRMKAANLLCRS